MTAAAPDARPPSTRAGDDADAALAELILQLQRTDRHLSETIDRATQVAAQRDVGRSWCEIVQGEERPLIVERISRALADLGWVGGTFRREEARALQREGLSITEISTLFGVTRQRVSVLVRRDPHEDGATSAEPGGRRPPRR